MLNFEKRQKTLYLMMLIVDLSNQANEHGILSLEERIPSLNSDFLKKAIYYLVEGFNEKELEKMLGDEPYLKEEFETEHLERQLIKQGVIWILSDNYGKSLFEKMLTVLGEDFFDYIDENWLN